MTRAAAATTDLEARFGRIDIYLFDQILRGRIAPGMRVLSGRRCALPDGSERYLVDEPLLVALTGSWAGGSWIRSRRRWCRISVA